MTPRMRTIKLAAQWIKANDPESAIGEAWIRKQIRSGQLSYVQSGNRQLVNLDTILRLLETGVTDTVGPEQDDDVRPVRMRKI